MYAPTTCAAPACAHTPLDHVALQHGILAGGLADGSVVLWDPTAIVDPKARADGKPALLAKMQKHTGAVRRGST